MRPGRALAGALAVLFGLTGCAGNGVLDTPQARAIRQAVETTRTQPRSFVMELQQEGTTYLVRGVVADDQRYRMQLSVNGRPAFDEVVVDDAVAVRSLSPEGLKTMICPVLARGEAKLTPALATSFNALTANRWVLDDDGAPSQLPRVINGKKLGDDPIVDAITVFDYFEAAVQESIGSTANPGRGFVKFDKEAFDYNPEKDPLPQVVEGAQRYDLVRRRLPRKADLQSEGNSAGGLITQANFRHLSLYLANGKVRELRDTIDMRQFVKDIDELFDVKAPPTLSEDDRAALALRRLNRFLRKKGQPEVTQHSLAIRFEVLRPGAAAIVLPKDAVKGQLDLLKDHGRSAFLAQNDDACRGSVDSQEAAAVTDLENASRG